MENLQKVVDHLKIKRDKHVGHENIHPLLLILPGGMRGAAGAGAAVALHVAGFADVFDTVVGISTGAPIGAYFLSGQQKTILGASLYYEELASRDFINVKRLREIMRLDILLSAMQTGVKSIDEKKILSSPTKFYVSATTIRGRPELLDAKKAKPSLLAAIHASMAIPGAGPKPVNVNGVNYVDGGLFPFPIQSIIDCFHPTDILVLPNFPCPADGTFHLSMKDVFSSLFVLRTKSLTLTKLALLRRKKLTQGLRYAKTVPHVNMGIIWPPQNTLHHFTINPQTLRDSASAAGQAALDSFGEGSRPLPLR